jgi:chlorite dismutase
MNDISEEQWWQLPYDERVRMVQEHEAMQQYRTPWGKLVAMHVVAFGVIAFLHGWYSYWMAG